MWENHLKPASQNFGSNFVTYIAETNWLEIRDTTRGFFFFFFLGGGGGGGGGVLEQYELY
jgi:hypothetical protein